MKLKEQEIYLEKKLQELLIKEGELLHRRNDLEKKENYLCQLLNSTPIQDHSLSLIEINEKIQDHIQMLTDLKVYYLIVNLSLIVNNYLGSPT